MRPLGAEHTALLVVEENPGVKATENLFDVFCPQALEVKVDWTELEGCYFRGLEAVP